MIFHVSIPAANPQRVASVLAEIWRGEAFAFPPIAQGSLIVMAGDERNSAIEVYPLGTELHPVEGDADAQGRTNPQASSHSATHVAIATPLSTEAVMAIAQREGWLAKYRKRGGMFGVIELWVENALMLEVLTDSMAQEYLASLTPAKWRAAMAAGPRSAPIEA